MASETSDAGGGHRSLAGAPRAVALRVGILMLLVGAVALAVALGASPRRDAAASPSVASRSAEVTPVADGVKVLTAVLHGHTFTDLTGDADPAVSVAISANVTKVSSSTIRDVVFSGTVTGVPDDGWPLGYITVQKVTSTSTATATEADRNPCHASLSITAGDSGVSKWSCSNEAALLQPGTHKFHAIYTPSTPSSNLGPGVTYAQGISGTVSVKVFEPDAVTTLTLTERVPTAAYGKETQADFAGLAYGDAGDGWPEGTVDVETTSSSTVVCAGTLKDTTGTDAEYASIYTCQLSGTTLDKGSHTLQADFVPRFPASSSTATQFYSGFSGTSVTFLVPGGTSTTKLYVRTGAHGTTCTGSTPSSACSSIERAVTVADTDAGTMVVTVGPGTYGGGVDVTASGLASLAIEGAGASETTVTGQGHGDFSVTHGTVAITGFTISGGLASVGGGIAVQGTSDVSATEDALSYDTAYGSGGGGIGITGGGTLTATDDTFAHDFATGSGGGIYSTNSTVYAVDDTFAHDFATGSGGGIYSTSSTVHAVDDTFAHDSAPTASGLDSTGGTVNVTASIFDGASCASTGGSLSGAYDVTTTTTCDFGAQGDETVSATALDLSPTLRTNTSTGPETLAIGTSSAAYDHVPLAGPSTACVTGISTDERGTPRPGVPGEKCDAGAYEYQTGATVNTGPTFTLYVSTTGAPGTTATCTASTTTYACATLPWAVSLASSESGSVVVTVGPGTYTGFHVTAYRVTSLVIEGAGATQTTVTGHYDGTGAIYVTGGTVTISGVSIERGKATEGGGVYETRGTLTLADDILAQDTATYDGGAVYNEDGNVVLTADTFTGDSARTTGGAIYSTGGTLVLMSDTFTGDSAPTAGGAIYSTGGTVTATDDTFSHDSSNRRGGGIDDTSGSLSATDDTFSLDRAEETGGGIFVEDSSFTLTDDTFSHDSAGFGGGVTAYLSKGSVTNATFFADDASTRGGAYGVDESTASFTDVTFATDGAPTGSGVFVEPTSTVSVLSSVFSTASCGGTTVTDEGFNIETGSSCGFTTSLTGSLSTAPAHGTTSTAINLHPLTANTSTGPKTMAIGPTSAAYHLVPHSTCAVTTDERGEPRSGTPGTDGTACDAGAYEYQRGATIPTPGTVRLYVVQGRSGTSCTGTTLVEACGSIAGAAEVAESYSGKVTITVGPGTFAGGITVTASTLTALVIEGAGASTTIVTGGGTEQDFTVTGGTVTISGLSVDDGYATGAGGGVYNTGRLTLSDDTFSEDFANAMGGAIVNSGTLTTHGDTFTHDQAEYAGAIATDPGGELHSADDTFSYDSALTTGGAVGAFYSSGVTLTDDTFAGDAALVGGAIAAYTDTVTLLDDTLSKDTSEFEAGGVYATDATVDATDVTLYADSSQYGGAYAVFGGDASFTDVTFATDSATDGGGIFETFATVSVSRSILAGASCNESVSSDSYDVETGDSCDFTTSGATPSVNTAPTSGTGGVNLHPLAANTSTGPKTMAIGETSAAFRLVPVSTCSVTTDERGLHRPGTGATSCDAGAYEYQTGASIATVGTTTLYVLEGATGTSCTATTTDEACGSIAAAVAIAEADLGTVTITVGPGMYVGGIEIAALTLTALVIRGAGASTTIVTGGGTEQDFVVTGGTVTISGFSVKGGHAEEDGGGVAATRDAAVTITSDSFSTDFAIFDGGAVAALEARATTLSDNTFYDDAAGTDGGAIFGVDGQTITSVNDTFDTDESGADGGAVETFSNPSTFIDDTFYDAAPSTTGPAVEVVDSPMTVSESILDDTWCTSAGGSLTGSYDVTSTSSCTFGQTDDQIVTAATLALTTTLKPNRSTGPETLAIGPTSTAFHHVPVTVCSSVMTDERGEPRPGTGSAFCDAGAYESQAPTQEAITSTSLVVPAPSSEPYGTEAQATFSGTVTGASGFGYPEGTVDVVTASSPTTVLCTGPLSDTTGADAAYVSTYSCTLTPEELAAAADPYSLEAVYVPGTPLSSSTTAYAYANAHDGTASFSVTKSSPVFSISVTPNPASYGISAKVSEVGLTEIAGSVSVTTTSTPAVLCTITLPAMTCLTPSTLPIGLHTLVATFTPTTTTNYESTVAATGTLAFEVTKPTKTVASTTISPATATEPYGTEALVTFSGTVTGVTGFGYPEGTVEVVTSSSSIVVCTGALSETGSSSYVSKYSCTPAAKKLAASASPYTLSATFVPAGGTASSSTSNYTYANANDGTAAFTVSHVTKTVASTSVSGTATATYGTEALVMFSGTVTGVTGFGDPEGTVEVVTASSPTTVLCTVPLTANTTDLSIYACVPSATALPASLTAYTLEAVYLPAATASSSTPSVSYANANDGTASFTVSFVTRTVASTSVSGTATATYGTEALVMFSGTVTGVTGFGYPEGTVEVVTSSSSIVVCTGALSETGSSSYVSKYSCSPASGTVLAVAAGAYSLEAVFVPGSPTSSSTPSVTYANHGDGSTTIAVHKPTETIASTSVSGTATATYGTEALVTFSGTVTGVTGFGYPEGTVEVVTSSSSIVVCTGALSETGSSSYVSKYSCSPASGTVLAVDAAAYSLEAVFVPGSPTSSSNPNIAYANHGDATAAFTVTKEAPSFTISVSPSSEHYGTSATVSETGLAGIGGTVTVTTTTGAAVCTITLSTSTSCTTPTDLTDGSYTLEAAFSPQTTTNYTVSAASDTPAFKVSTAPPPTTPTTVTPTPPAAPTGSTTSKGAQSSTPKGTATVTDAPIGLSATATGEGALTVAGYASNPTTTTLSAGTGKYLDVELATGSAFTKLTIRVCDVATGDSLDWWNGTTWEPFSDATLGSTGCISATVTSTSSPTLADLTGTVVAVVKTTTTTTATTPPTSTSGYWLVTSQGAVTAFGTAKSYGTAAHVHLAAPIVGIVATPTGKGYWLVAADGGVFTFGSARFYGSMGGKHLAAPVVGMAAAPTGNGYWLVASDGGVFTFGSARFYGSMGGKHLAAPVVGMAAAPTGKGYWLVAADGGVFTFGSARFYGSMGGKHLDAPVVGMAAAPTGNGYWLVASDGGVFTFGSARFYGSPATTHPSSPVSGVALGPTGKGYWLITKDGGVFSDGDATPEGSGVAPGSSPVVGIAAAS